MVRSHGVSESGAVRQTNEDCFLADDDIGLFVVADGIGGHAAGEVAAQAAVESIRHFMRRSEQADDLSWPCGIDPTLTASGNRVRTAIYLANRSVLQMADGDDRLAGMGTTVVCALVRERHLAFGHVGDSRLYVYAGGVLAQQTRDDTWAATLVEANPSMGVSAVATHPLRNVLTNILGGREPATIHVAERDLAGDELLLLCTDGVHGVLDTDTLTTLLGSSSGLTAMADSVIAAAIERGSRDNLTALLVRYGGDSGHA